MYQRPVKAARSNLVSSAQSGGTGYTPSSTRCGTHFWLDTAQALKVSMAASGGAALEARGWKMTSHKKHEHVNDTQLACKRLAEAGFATDGTRHVWKAPWHKMQGRHYKNRAARQDFVQTVSYA